MAARKETTQSKKLKKAAPKKKSSQQEPTQQKIAASRGQAQDIPIVGIGASAGGLEAIEGFFAHTPSGINIAFVIIQHLAPEHKSIMASLLNKYTKMKITEIEDGMGDVTCPKDVAE